MTPFRRHLNPGCGGRECGCGGWEMWYIISMRCGQTMVEYVLVLVLLMAAVTAAGWVVKAVRAQSERSETLLGSDFP